MRKVFSILSVFAIILSLTLMTMTSCEKLDVPDDTPSCIKREIRKIESANVRNPPAKVYEWDFNRIAVT